MLPNLSGLGLGAPTGPMLAVTEREKVTCMITQEECELGAYAWFLNVYVSGDSGPTEQLPHPYNVLALAEWLQTNRKAPDTNQIVTEEDRVNCINTARVLEEYARERYRAPAPAVAPAVAPAPGGRFVDTVDTVDTVRPLPNPRTLPRRPVMQAEWPLPLSVSPPASPGRGRGRADSPVPQRSGSEPTVQEKLAELEAALLRASDDVQVALVRRDRTENSYRAFERDPAWRARTTASPGEQRRLTYKEMRMREAKRLAAERLAQSYLALHIAERRLAWYTNQPDRLVVVDGQLRAYRTALRVEGEYADPGYVLDDLEDRALSAQEAERLRRSAAIREITAFLVENPNDSELQRMANSHVMDYGDWEFAQDAIDMRA